MSKDSDLCPCHSGKKYADCCGPLHEGKPAESALALMRSRYSGYALKKIDYLIKTTHPDHPDSKKPMGIRRKDIKRFSECREFRDLHILTFKDNEDGTATVRFRAILFQDGKDCSFEENSLFKKEGDFWLYAARLEK